MVKAQKLKPGDQLVGEESHPVISSLDSNLAAHSSTPLKWSELPWQSSLEESRYQIAI